MKNVLLTGAKGFIGRHLTQYLQNRHNVIGVDIDNLDLLDTPKVTDFIKQNKIDFIIHCAAVGVKINNQNVTDEVIKPNLQMFHNLSGLCPMIVLGSGAEYDKRRNIQKIKESDFGQSVPVDPYGYAKYLISKEIEKMDNVLNLRLFGVYGVGENDARVTTSIVKANLAHEPIILNQNVVFDFIWMDDFCQIVDKFIEKMPDEKFINLTPTHSIEIAQLAKIVNDFSDFKSEIMIKNDGLNKEYTGDNDRLMSALGGFDFTSYETGMKKLYEGIKHDT